LVSTLVTLGSRSTRRLILAIVVVVILLRSVAIAIVVSTKWHATIELSLDKAEDLLNELNGVRSLKQVSVEVGGRELLSLIVQISLILRLCLLLLADLRELVVGHIELLSVDRRAV